MTWSYLTRCWWSIHPTYSPTRVLSFSYSLSSSTLSFFKLPTMRIHVSAISTANAYLPFRLFFYGVMSLAPLMAIATFLEATIQVPKEHTYDTCAFSPLALFVFRMVTELPSRNAFSTGRMITSRSASSSSLLWCLFLSAVESNQCYPRSKNFSRPFLATAAISSLSYISVFPRRTNFLFTAENAYSTSS